MEMLTGLPEAGVSMIDSELPFTTASLKVNAIFVDGDTLLLPCTGLYVVMVGATVSATVNWYVLPDKPPNQLPAASLTQLFGIVTVYRMPPLAVERLDDGLIVTVLPEMLTSYDVMEMVTGLPETGDSVIEPELPFTTVSLKVNTIFVDGDTLLLPRAGLYVVIVGATASETDSE
jgi:hypothetical protein